MVRGLLYLLLLECVPVIEGGIIEGNIIEGGIK